MTKAGLGEGNTAYAQGGIAAAVGADDSLDRHLADTVRAGADTVDPEAVRTLVSAGPAAVAELARLGVVFDVDGDGGLSLGLEGAHSRPRILHAGGDATGAVIQHALDRALRDRGVEVRTHTLAIELIIERGRVRGLAVARDGETSLVPADAVILAAGGAGQLFAHTTNPAVATGDGIALALRAGAAVTDLEFTQFHPTALADGTLVSEAVRGEGAVLVDDVGRRFCLDEHPAGELAPRDVVARAMAAAMSRQGGRPVRLDATRLRATPAATAAFLAGRFPTIDRAVRERGWDWAREPIPVTPAAHYLMGGVVTDLHGRTSVAGLYAAGEVARTGVHGANRLASNSLLEAAVFGARAGEAVAADARGTWPDVAPPAPPAVRRPADAPSARPAPPFSRLALQQLMWEHVGLRRDGTGLAHARAVLEEWSQTPRETRTVRGSEDASLLLVARAMTAAAFDRRGSLGSHHRVDDAGAADAGIAAAMPSERVA
ncbi:L-aspartate oxidase [Microbacterium oleivorans]|uniref:L-aspartate oxidase n=1 Tax=Microbacterium oleivorans TaxID=273677 RepID=A0A7D5JC74_9MICO|nr:L-aspartate oxidase [Microbacterium oleivorans]QLD10600.1 L-aspartate oxidase [Microbacterium oleivorans]